MELVIERGAGLDVHKKTVAVCVRVPGAHGKREQHVRTFGTTAGELLVLRDWLEAHGVTHVAMESPGVYWKPIFYVLEGAFTCVLANARHIAQLPGKKTDARPGPDARGQPPAQDARGRRHQARLGGSHVLGVSGRAMLGH